MPLEDPGHKMASIAQDFHVNTAKCETRIVYQNTRAQRKRCHWNICHGVCMHERLEVPEKMFTTQTNTAYTLLCIREAMWGFLRNAALDRGQCFISLSLSTFISSCCCKYYLSLYYKLHFNYKARGIPSQKVAWYEMPFTQFRKAHNYPRRHRRAIIRKFNGTRLNTNEHKWTKRVPCAWNNRREIAIVTRTIEPLPAHATWNYRQTHTLLINERVYEIACERLWQ